MEHIHFERILDDWIVDVILGEHDCSSYASNYYTSVEGNIDLLSVDCCSITDLRLLGYYLVDSDFDILNY
jgi:hypothetical protein